MLARQRLLSPLPIPAALKEEKPNQAKEQTNKRFCS